jgi:GTP 3',8-cyclase
VDYIGYKTRSIDPITLKHTVIDMGRQGVRSIMFAGEGEPLLHPKLDFVINWTKAANIDVAITTNGVPLTTRFVDSCLHNISWIKVSMNGGSTSYAQVHKARPKDYNLVWDNLRYAVKVRNSNKLDTVIGIQCVMLPENTQDLDELCFKARETGLDYIVIKPYSQHKSSITRTYEDIKYEQDTQTRLDTLAQTYSTKDFQVIVRHKSMDSWNQGEHTYKKCYSTPYMWAYIMASGDVYGCSAYLLDERFRYGNINESSFRDIWLGEKRRTSIAYVANELDIHECRLNCRMSKVNQFLWDVKQGESNPHKNFI